jgi:hypothetical protein
MWHAILREVGSHTDLRNLARACRFLQPEAERLLWSSILAFGIPSIVSLCKRVSAMPRLACYVKILSLLEGVPYKYDFEQLHVWSLLQGAFERMVSLEHLTILVGRDLSMPKFVSLPFKLRYFASTFCLDENLVSFFTTQPDILELKTKYKADFAPGEYILPPSILPRLRIVEVMDYDSSLPLSWMLDQRPVTHMRLHSTTHHLWHDIISLRNQPKALHFEYKADQAALSEFLPPNALNVEVLCGLALYICLRSKSIMSGLSRLIHNQGEEEHLIKLFSRLHKLKAVEIAISSAWIQGLGDGSSLELLNDFRKVCSSLGSVMLRCRKTVWLWKWDGSAWAQVANPRDIWMESRNKTLREA